MGFRTTEYKGRIKLAKSFNSILSNICNLYFLNE